MMLLICWKHICCTIKKEVWQKFDKRKILVKEMDVYVLKIQQPSQKSLKSLVIESRTINILGISYNHRK